MTRKRLVHYASIAAAALFAAAAPPAGARERAGSLPPPGSYALSHIQRVPKATVLEGSEISQPLSRYTEGAVTLLGFFYAYCADPNGCPLAWEAFEKVRETIIARPALHGRVRLVFMSLDPVRDTPGTLSVLARHYEERRDIVPWHFLTTYSNHFLAPLLREMGEEISIDRAAAASGGVVLNHLLKVFLIDKEGWVREIYSNQSLDPAAILGDIETLLLEVAALSRQVK
ncbi:MAG: SCO family protein [Beijerinckiaceae bacterium]|nr:SCO family protein [Beijerinckiaceae bacterium]